MDILIRYVIAMLFMLAALLLWFTVQRLSRQFAATHPEFGPAREEGGGCGSGGKCNCSSAGQCSKTKVTHKISKK